MHPRNRYAVPPSFEALAADRPEFAPFLVRREDGSVTVDFHDPASVRHDY